MATPKSLPARPSLESLRKQAKKLTRDVAAGDSEALSREDQLRITERQRWLCARQVSTHARNRVAVAGGNVTRELLGLLPEGLQGWTCGELFRRDHGDLLS